jgi:NAD(P)-dependent dehydrogenase (short-subunit alcohol dehydrogenase family)/acyl carrier protein
VYAVEWRPFPVTGQTTDAEIVRWQGGSVAEALAMVQAHVTSDRPHLAVVTTNAVATHPAETIASTVDAAVRGLLRSAQSEHPGRITLVDTDTSDTAEADVAPVVAAAREAGEPQVAIRAGRAMVARLAIAPPAREPAWHWEGTVLVTGGTGTIGAAVARHLVAQHDIRSLVLVSRRGPDAPSATELRAELEEAGATVHLAACDVTDRVAVEKLLAEVPPVRGIVHAAAALADGVLTNLTAEQTEHVIAAKLDSATHLRDLTDDLTAFVVFSSWAGLSGAAGQANYAAANTAVDALAHNLRADGVPAASLAWGFWTDRSGLTGALSDADVARLGRSGVAGVDVDGSLALMDAAAHTGHAVVAPVRLDPAAVADDVPALLRELIQPRTTEKATPTDLRHLVVAHTAAVLGHPDPRAVEENRGFLDQGMTSLTAVDLRNRLSADTGLRLPVTMIFDYPTPRALVAHLREQLGDTHDPVADPVAAAEAAIARLDPADRSQLIQRLTTTELGARDDDEMFALIDKELGLA